MKTQIAINETMILLDELNVINNLSKEDREKIRKALLKISHATKLDLDINA